MAAAQNLIYQIVFSNTYIIQLVLLYTHLASYYNNNAYLAMR